MYSTTTFGTADNSEAGHVTSAMEARDGPLELIDTGPGSMSGTSSDEPEEMYLPDESSPPLIRRTIS